MGKSNSETLKRLYSSGKLIVWNKNLTKETDGRVKKYGLSGSKTIKKQFLNGREKPKGMLNHSHTKEWKEKLSKRNSGKNNPFYNKKHSDETKESIRSKTFKQMLTSRKFSYTKPEVFFYDELGKRKIDFVPQFNLNNKFLVDAFIPFINTLVQVDGNYWHNLERVIKKDKSFNAYAKKCGYRVVRFWEKDIYENIDKCIENLLKI